MIPGPSEPEPEVLAELSLPILPHYGDKWMAVYQDTVSMAQKVFRTKNEVIILPTPGHLAVEMAVENLAEKGQDVFVCVNGFFSETIVGMATAVGANPVVDPFRARQRPNPRGGEGRGGGEGRPSGQVLVLGPERDLHRRCHRPEPDFPLRQEQGNAHRP